MTNATQIHEPPQSTIQMTDTNDQHQPPNAVNTANAGQ